MCVDEVRQGPLYVHSSLDCRRSGHPRKNHDTFRVFFAVVNKQPDSTLCECAYCCQIFRKHSSSTMVRNYRIEQYQPSSSECIENPSRRCVFVAFLPPVALYQRSEYNPRKGVLEVTYLCSWQTKLSGAPSQSSRTFFVRADFNSSSSFSGPNRSSAS